MALDRMERGRQLRSEVMGKEVIDRVLGNAGEIEREQQALFTAYAWCDVFDREGISKATRVLINIAVLSVLGERETMKLHVGAAARLGCTTSEIRETLIQAGAIASGVRAVLACRAADEALHQIRE